MQKASQKRVIAGLIFLLTVAAWFLINLSTDSSNLKSGPGDFWAKYSKMSERVALFDVGETTESSLKNRDSVDVDYFLKNDFGVELQYELQSRSCACVTVNKNNGTVASGETLHITVSIDFLGVPTNISNNVVFQLFGADVDEKLVLATQGYVYPTFWVENTVFTSIHLDAIDRIGSFWVTCDLESKGEEDSGPPKIVDAADFQVEQILVSEPETFRRGSIVAKRFNLYLRHNGIGDFSPIQFPYIGTLICEFEGVRRELEYVIDSGELQLFPRQPVLTPGSKIDVFVVGQEPFEVESIEILGCPSPLKFEAVRLSDSSTIVSIDTPFAISDAGESKYVGGLVFRQFELVLTTNLNTQSQISCRAFSWNGK